MTSDGALEELIEESFTSAFNHHAAGRLDAHCESLAPWDVAAAGLIATEADAIRGNLAPHTGSLPPTLRGEEFLVATPAIYDKLAELLGPD